MKHLKGNLHTHSTKSDGNLSPEELIKKYREEGFDFVAVTDHRDKPEPHCYSDIDGILVLEGCEVSKAHHWNYIEGDEETLTVWNHPFRYDDTVRGHQQVWQGCRRNHRARRLLLQRRDSRLKDCRAEQVAQRRHGRRPLEAHDRPLVDLGSGVGKGERRDNTQHQER